ncbi:hypothetical protein AMELA_G00224270 [Ameiurus melas]|uniref:Uncharacterized protein n=1 Tax=Ameiurus melas TaxID=219545 RepID=A0A7J5ZZ44_AMEME|nr:hypothetical protein AMELA_G00224270 [Ameiurus melas]
MGYGFSQVHSAVNPGRAEGWDFIATRMEISSPRCLSEYPQACKSRARYFRRRFLDGEDPPKMFYFHSSTDDKQTE